MEETKIHKLKLGKRSKIILIIIAAIIATAFIIDQITPQPFVLIFRSLINLTDSAVKIGPYADDIQDVEEIKSINISVEGSPDAQLKIYSLKNDTNINKPLILYIHGGGWVIGSADSVAPYAKLLASNGYVVANLEYSLAPEYKYPTPIKQSIAAINYLQIHAEEFNADSTKFFIAGNSAGAQITSQLGAIMTNDNYEKQVGVTSEMPAENLKGLILFNGVYDFDTVGRDNFPGFAKYAWSYTGEKDYVNYERIDELSTVKNITSDYPATFLTAGDADPIEAQTYQFDAVLRARGVDVTSVYWTGSGKGLGHDYMYLLESKEARNIYEGVVRFVADKVNK